MWKKMGIAALAAVAIAGAGTPAFAATANGGWGGHHGHGHGNQIGLFNSGDIDVVHTLSGVLGLCGDDLAGAGGVVPILSPNGTKGCAGGLVVGGNSHN